MSTTDNLGTLEDKGYLGTSTHLSLEVQYRDITYIRMAATAIGIILPVDDLFRVSTFLSLRRILSNSCIPLWKLSRSSLEALWKLSGSGPRNIEALWQPPMAELPVRTIGDCQLVLPPPSPHTLLEMSLTMHFSR